MAEPYRILMYRPVSTDLQRIFAHIARDSPQNAASTVARILDLIQSSKTFPHRAVVEVDNPTAPLRSLPVPPYLVFFRVFDENRIVKVLHVRHGARRRPKRL
jgi:plasmid stabilization system protein ParE